MKRERSHFPPRLCARFCAGFTLGEVLIAVLCLGLLLAPFLRLVTSLPAMQRQLSYQARDEAWRSFQDHALSVGVDPSHTPALLAALNPAVPSVKPESVERRGSSASLSSVSLRVLRSSSGASYPEDRPGGSGWELSRGPDFVPADPPAPPLLPVTMQRPAISPSPGALISLFSIEQQGEPKQPGLLVRASSQENARVWLTLGRTGSPKVGVGEVEGFASVDEFAVGNIGTSWTEYHGEPAAGHQLVELPDGRKRWLVPEGRGVRTYEPSEIVTWTYTLDLGSPILRYASSEIPSGGLLLLDYVGMLGVRNGTIPLRVDWSDATKALLGGSLERLSSGFESSFAGGFGPVSGDLSVFCSEPALDSWNNLNPLVATARPASGCIVQAAGWTLGRSLTEMGEPELVTAMNGESAPSPTGSAEFAPPAQADGVRRGRLSARDGALVSSSPSLSLMIIP